MSDIRLIAWNGVKFHQSLHRTPKYHNLQGQALLKIVEFQDCPKFNAWGCIMETKRSTPPPHFIYAV